MAASASTFEDVESYTSDASKAKDGEYSTSRAITMVADGANEGIFIDALSSPGYIVDGINWALGFAGLGSEDPFLGSRQLRAATTWVYEGYFKLLGKNGSPVPESNQDRMFHTGGKIAGDVALAAMTLGQAYAAKQTAIVTGEATRAMTQSAVRDLARQTADDAIRAGGSGTSKLSLLQRWRVAGSTDNLAYRLRMIQQSEGTDAAMEFLQRASRSRIEPSQVMLMEQAGMDSRLITAARQIADKQLASGSLTNWFSRAGRTISYVVDQPGHASWEALKSVGRAVADPIGSIRTAKSALVKGALWAGGGTAALLGVDFGFNKGEGTEFIADQLPEGSAKTALYTATIAVQGTEDEAAQTPGASGTAEAAPKSESRETAERIVGAARKVKDTAADFAGVVGVTGGGTEAEDSGKLFQVPGWFKEIPGLGWLGWLVEKAVQLFNDYVRPMFTSADEGNLDVQGDAERARRVMQQSGHDPASGATATVVPHEGGEPETVALGGGQLKPVVPSEPVLEVR